MADSRIIAVTGATGMQGGGLAQAILDDPDGGFTCRAITRDPSKPAARELAQRGAEVVAADLNDQASLQRAFAGAYSVYAVTNFFETFSAEREKAQAKHLADAARATQVQHVIWSTLEDTRPNMPAGDKRMPLLQERYRVPHLDGKSEADAFFEGLPVTYLLTSFYWENLYLFGAGPRPDGNGGFAWVLPLGSSRLPAMAGEDIGRVAYGVFKAGSRYIGKRVGVAAEMLTVEQMREHIQRVLGVQSLKYVPVDADAYRAFGFPGAEEVGNMYQYFRDFEEPACALRSTELARQLHPGLLTFEQFLRKHGDKVRGAMQQQ